MAPDGDANGEAGVDRRASHPRAPTLSTASVKSDMDDAQPTPALLRASPLGSVWETLLTYWVSLQVAVAHLITPETIFVCSLQAGATCFYFFYRPDEEPLVAKLSLSFFSFIIVFPITANIGYAFVRRERALAALADLRSLVFHLYLAHNSWSWPVKGDFVGRRLLATTPRYPQHGNQKEAAAEAGGEGERGAGARGKSGDDGACEGGVDCTRAASEEKSSPAAEYYEGGAAAHQHVAEVRETLIRMTRAMRDFLRLPLANRSKHMFTRSGQRMRKHVRPVQRRCLAEIYAELSRLSLAVERMKAVGLPGNEAARMNQYLMLLTKEFEQCRAIKGYRTPTGLRAFGRLYILTHPFFIGPYYAWVAGAGRVEASQWPFQANLGFAIALAIFTGVAMQGLFNIAIGLEDPFDDTEGLDDVRVEKIFGELEIRLTTAWAPGSWDRSVMYGGSICDAVLESREEELPAKRYVDGYEEVFQNEPGPMSLWGRCL
eukprot:PRCOL_00006401-RA